MGNNESAVLKEDRENFVDEPNLVLGLDFIPTVSLTRLKNLVIKSFVNNQDPEATANFCKYLREESFVCLDFDQEEDFKKEIDCLRNNMSLFFERKDSEKASFVISNDEDVGYALQPNRKEIFQVRRYNC